MYGDKCMFEDNDLCEIEKNKLILDILSIL